MDFDFLENARPISFAQLLVPTGKEQVVRACVALIKEHYQSSPGIVVEECFHQGLKADRLDVIAAALSLATRLASFPGCEALLDNTKQRWVDRITIDGCSMQMLQGYVEQVLDGDVSTLWKTPVGGRIGGYSSHMAMWINLSPQKTLTKALELIRSHESGVVLPAKHVLACLAGIEEMNLSRLQVVSIVDLLPLEDHATAIDRWLSSRNPSMGMAFVVVASQFKNHEIWRSSAFWQACTRHIHPPAIERLAQVLPPRKLDWFGGFMDNSTAADIWHDALAARRAQEQSNQLDQQTPSASASRSNRL